MTKRNSATITRADGADYQTLIEIWERSVRATHHFLHEADILHYRGLILKQYFDLLMVYVLTDNNQKVGFIGLSGNKIEMLFIDPSCFGRRFGNTLLDYAVNEHGATFVDVNEQNPGACKFYEKNGFVVFQRDELDNDGKNFPILRMRLGVNG